MKRTEIPAVKVWSDHDGEPSPKLDYKWMDRTKSEATPIPCILRTAAADKLILDVLCAVLEEGNFKRPVWEAVQKLKKAGVKL